MELEVKRRWFGPKATIGELYVDDERECFTLEDVVRADGVKIKGETAIPAGRYQVVITHSQRFGRDLPLLMNVPMFAGIRIHPGNTDVDTHGCILVGETKAGDDFIGNSRLAFSRLFEKLRAAAGPMWITITDEEE